MAVVPELSVAVRAGTTPAVLDQMMDELRQGARRLASSSLSERIRLAGDCIASTSAAAREWVRIAARAKQIPSDSPAIAEEILSGPVSVLRYLQLTIRTLQDLSTCGVPQLPASMKNERGQIRVATFPARSLFDRLVFLGVTAETWLQPNVTQDRIFGDVAERLRRDRDVVPRITTVLGAGNVSAIPATDALTMIFQNDSVVLLKMNPVNEYLGEVIEQSLRPLIQAGFLRIIYGGAEQGRAAVNHPSVGAVHITGSTASHDAIVWGSDPGQRQRRQRDQPLISVPVTSELGNVTPWVIVPGDYSDSQLRSQAENIVASIVNNASFNCIATKMLITWKQWPARERFLNLIESILSGIPRRCAYYPGAADRFADFSGSSEGPDKQGRLPWILRKAVDPEREPHLFAQESFVCVTGETSLEAASPLEFLDRAVDFMNERIWGTLAATLTVPDEMQKRHSTRMEAATERLQYGTVGINQWTGVAYGLMSPPWGAFPVEHLSEVQSGLGSVHNTFLLDRPQKTVIRSPLSMFPRPVWFSTNRRPEAISWRLLELYSRPSVWRLPGLLAQAVRG